MAVKAAAELVRPLGKSFQLYDEGAEWIEPKEFRDVRPGVELIAFSSLKQGTKSQVGLTGGKGLDLRPSEDPVKVEEFAPLLERESFRANLALLERQEGGQTDPAKKAELRKRRIELFLLVLRTVEKKSRTKYCLSSAGEGTAEAELVRAACARYTIEDCIERAKGEVGMAQYEVRSWTGWRHHMTLALLASWFLVSQNRRLQRRFPPFTVQQVRFCVAEFLRDPDLDVVELARKISRTLTRNEQARIHHWDNAKPLPGATKIGDG